MPVNFPSVLHREQKLVRHALHLGAGDFKRPADVRDGNLGGEFGMPVNERLHVRRRRRLGDGVGHVNREEIRRRDETIHGFEADMVGVHVVGFFPAERGHGVVGLGAEAGRLGADEGVFAVGLVPDGDEFRAEFRGQHAGGKLRLALMAEAVAHAEGKFTEREVLFHKMMVAAG